MKKILVLILLWLGYTGTGLAQQTGLAAFGETEPPATPAQLFQLNPEQYNNHFDFVLPDNGRLFVDFLRLSDWGSENQLQAIAETAATQVRLLKDSFTTNYSTKLLTLNIPVNGKIISVNYKEDDREQHQLAYKDGDYYQLKTGFDTIRVIKNTGIRTKPEVDSGLIQVQYTFVLKDINDIQVLADNPETLQRIGMTADSAVNKQRRRWSRQDAMHHSFSMKYDPNAPRPLVTDNGDGSAFSFIRKRIGISLAVGFATYTNNSVSPYFDESLSYLIPTRGKMQYFAGVNATAFGYMNLNGDQSYYTSYNVEYGLCKKSTGFMQQKTSMQIGLMRRFNVPQPYNMFHMGFNFGFNSYLSAGFNVASDFKKNSNRNLLLVNFKFNL